MEDKETMEKEEKKDEKSGFIRVLNSLLDGGRTGVDVGLAIIPGVLIISTLVMVLTFGPSSSGAYTGAAYEGVAILPFLAEKINFIFESDCLPDHGPRCRRCRSRSCAQFHGAGMGGRQCHRRVHGYRNVLERLSEHSYRNA